MKGTFAFVLILAALAIMSTAGTAGINTLVNGLEHRAEQAAQY